MTWFLKVDDVTVKYEDFVALDSVSIEISKGDFIGLLGSNGAGKSTFINTMLAYNLCIEEAWNIMRRS